MLLRQFAYCSKICDADGNEPSKKVIKRSLVRAVKNFGRVPKTDNTWRKRVPFLTPTQCKNIWGKLWPKDVEPQKFTETIDKIMQKLKCDEHLEEDQAILDECKQWTEWKELHAEAENKEAEKKQEHRYFLSHAGRQALRRVKAEVSAGSDRIKEPSPNFKLPTMDELTRLFPDVIEVGPIQPGRISTSSYGPAKAIIEFGRFLRLHEAQAAWHRRLVQENTFAALGRQCVDLGFCYENRLEAEFGTPSFALLGRALHVPARNKCVAPSAAMDNELREDEILRKGPQMADARTPKECIAKKREIVQNFYQQLGEDVPKILEGHEKKALECDADDQDEFETLQKYWQLFHEYTKSRKTEDSEETGEFLVSKNGRTNCVISNFAQRRETFIVQMLGVTPELECSRWHCFLARLLLASHGDAELFVQVQLPFLAHEAPQPSTKNLRAEFLEDEKPVFDLWERTKQFLVQSCKQKHRKPQGVDDIVEKLEVRLKALIGVAPKIWKALFIVQNQVNSQRWERVTSIIGAALGEENFDAYHDSIVGSLLAAYPEVLLDEGDKGDKDAPTLSETAHRILKELCKDATNETNDEDETDSNCLRLLKDLQAKLQGQATSSACASSRFLDSTEVPSLDVLPSLLKDYDSWRAFLDQRKTLAGTILESIPESLHPHLERLKAIEGPEQLLPEDDVGLLRDMLLALKMPSELAMGRLIFEENMGARDVEDEDGGARNTEDDDENPKVKRKTTKKRKKAKTPSKKRKKRKGPVIFRAAEVSETKPTSLVQTQSQLVRRGHIDEMNLDFLDVDVEHQPIEQNVPNEPNELAAESDPPDHDLHPAPLQVAPVAPVAPDPERFALFGPKKEHLSEDQNRRLGLARSLMGKFVPRKD